MLNISLKVIYRANSIDFEVDLFIILKALYIISQPAYLRKAGHIFWDKHFETIKYFETNISIVKIAKVRLHTISNSESYNEKISQLSHRNPFLHFKSIKISNKNQCKKVLDCKYKLVENTNMGSTISTDCTIALMLLSQSIFYLPCILLLNLSCFRNVEISDKKNW